MKPYDIAKTAKNLKYKGKIEEILKIIKKNLVELFSKLTNLEDISKNLEIKIKECDEKSKQIEVIEKEIKNSEMNKELMKNIIKEKKKN